MKLAACYTVFDGMELLNKAIETIRPHLDLVIICYQTTSNNGKLMSDPDVEILKTFVGKHILLSYNTDLSVNAKTNERRKHTMMIDKARQLGATHFIMGATDHFYDPMEFDFAKRLVDEMDFDATFTGMYTYFKHPTWQITPIEEYFMPFICKMYPHTTIDRVKNFPLLVDPSVQMNTWDNWYLFKQFEIMLHHYSLVRKDIKGKFINAASPWKPSQIEQFTKDWNEYDIKENPGIMYFQGRKVKVVRDYFDLSPIFTSV
jgi:hypothetical protein